MSRVTEAAPPTSASPHYFRHDPHELQQLIESFLARNAYLAGRNLSVEVAGEDLVLRGVVQSYYQKQLAQESLRAVQGNRRIRNEIEVITR